MGIDLKELPNLAITLVLIAAVLVSVFLILDGLQTSQGYGGAGCNTTNQSACGSWYSATSNITSGTKAIIGFAPVWGVLLGVGVLLGIVIYAFRYFTGNNGGGGI